MPEERSYPVRIDRRVFVPMADGVRVADCEISPQRTQGTIQAKGKTFTWDFKISQAQESSFSWVPEGLARMGLTPLQGATLGEDLRFTGECSVDGEKFSSR